MVITLYSINNMEMLFLISFMILILASMLSYRTDSERFSPKNLSEPVCYCISVWLVAYFYKGLPSSLLSFFEKSLFRASLMNVEGFSIGYPQPGHTFALSLILLPHSGHLMIAISFPPLNACVFYMDISPIL